MEKINTKNHKQNEFKFLKELYIFKNLFFISSFIQKYIILKYIKF